MTRDVIDSDGGGKGFRIIAVLAAVAVGGALLVTSVHHKGSDQVGPAPSSAAPSSPMPTTTATPARALFPDIVVRIGDQLADVSDDGLRQTAQLPAGAVDVWATTLPTSKVTKSGAWASIAASGHVVHVFGVHDGQAFREDVAPRDWARDDIGTADAVLQTQEYPVLVRSGAPANAAVTVGTPGGSPVAIPVGWRPARFETLGFAGLLMRPIDGLGNVEIASWSPGGTPQPLTTGGRLIGVTDGGQAIWLDSHCAGGPDCRLFFGDIGGLHPGDGLPAPAGTRFVAQPAAFGGGGYLAALAVASGADVATAAPAASVVVLVQPWLGTTAVIAGSSGVVASAGMFWCSGTQLVFVADSSLTGGVPRLVRYDVGTGSSEPFGPALPAGVQLLTSYGSTSGVTVLP